MISAGVRHMLVSGIFFALMQMGVKYLSRVPFYEIAFFRGLVSLILCWIVLRQKRIPPLGNAKWILFSRGVAGTLGLVGYFYTLQEMPLASAATLNYLGPLFTIILAGFFMKESPRLIQFLFFLVSFSGVIFITGFDTRVSALDSLFGVGAAACAGVAYNLIRKSKGRDHPLVIVFYFPLVTVPTLGIYLIFHWTTPTLFEGLLLLLVGVSTHLAQYYMTLAYQEERASNVAHLTYIGIVYALASGFLLFGEVIQIEAFIGMMLVMVGVYGATRFSTAEKPETRGG